MNKIIIDLSEANLSRYKIPDIQADYADAAKVSLRLLDLAPSEVVIPLWATIYLSVLCEFFMLAEIPPAFVIWLHGLTGSFKSTLAALFLGHFGEFTNKTLPANFKDTAATLEKKAFLVKDSVLVIDDYHPVASGYEATEMRTKAQFILRAYGDLAARGRMDQKAMLRKAYVPRGLCIVTGEDTPNVGQSAAARYLGIAVEKGDIDIGLLSDLQREQYQLSVAMRGYIEYITDMIHLLPDMLKNKFIELRSRASSEAQHSRIPETIAWLQIGFCMGMEYAESIGAINVSQKEDLINKSWDVLITLAENQAEIISEEKPTNLFVKAVQEMFDAKTIYVTNIKEYDIGSNPASGESVGYVDEKYFYFFPGTIYRCAVEFSRLQNYNFPVSDKVLWKNLKNEGFSETEKDKTREYNLKQICFPNGSKKRMLVINKSCFES